MIFFYKDILEVFDELILLFSNELPEDFSEHEDVDDIIAEALYELKKKKEFAKAIQFIELIKQKQPEVYKDYFYCVDDLLIDYYCFAKEYEKANTAFASFINDPLSEPDIYLGCFSKLFYFQQIPILKQAVEKNYSELRSFAEEYENLVSMMGYMFTYNSMEEVYDEYMQTGKLNKAKYLNDIEQMEFSLQESLLINTEKGFHDRIFDIDFYKKNFHEDHKISMYLIHIHFLRYMQERGMSFALSYRIWQMWIVYFEEYNANEDKNPDNLFVISSEEFESFVNHLISNHFVDNTSDVFASVWGLVYIFDFIKSVNLITDEEYDYAIEQIRIQKGKLIGTFAIDL